MSIGSPATLPLELAIRLLRRSSFAGVHVAGVAREPPPQNEPVLLVANHVSWWDGFLLRDVGRLIRRKPVHLSVMSARELAARPFLRHVGAIGVDETVAGIRGMYRALARARDTTQGNLIVSYFPQGRIWPTTRRPLGFRRGVERVARMLAPLTVVPVAIHIEPLATLRPHAFVLLGNPIRAVRGELGAPELECAVERILDRLLRHLAVTGEEAHAMPADDDATCSDSPKSFSTRKPPDRARTLADNGLGPASTTNEDTDLTDEN